MASEERKQLALPPDDIAPGAILARDVIDYSVPGGAILLEKGSTLGPRDLALLREKNISNAFIYPKTKNSTAIDRKFFGTGAEKAVDPATGNLRIDCDKAADLHANVVSFATTMLGKIITNDDFDIMQIYDTVSIMQKNIKENEAAMLSLVHLKDADNYTFMHSVNVSVLGLLLGDRAGLNQQELRVLGTGAILHDIGKLVIDPAVLNKPGRLTEKEFLEIKNHPQKGYNLLRERGIGEDIAGIALTHHEKLNGHGYPLGIPAEQLSTLSRITAIADIYDALTADRVYKKAMHPFDALDIMEKERGSGLDSTLLDIFKNAVGTYPVSSLVLLKNGSTAKVVEQNRNEPAKPVIEILFDRHGIHPKQPILINTRTYTGVEYAITGIIRGKSAPLA